MSDLGRIESVYGSVAEYNRTRNEDSPSESLGDIKSYLREQMDSDIREALNPLPSEFVYDINRNIRQNNMTTYAGCTKVADSHDISLSRESYDMKNNQFSISYFDGTYGRYGKADFNVQPIDADPKAFSQLFEDMAAVTNSYNKWLIRYKDNDGNIHSAQGNEPSVLRTQTFKEWGIDDPECDSVCKKIKADYKLKYEDAKKQYYRNIETDDIVNTNSVDYESGGYQ